MQIRRPVRVEHSYTQQLQAPPGAVFPLLCPVREIEWVKGWEPNTVITQSGLNESDCVFLIEDKDVESIWTTTVWDPNKYRLEFLKVTPGRMVTCIIIDLEAEGDRATNAHITYRYTALSQEGERAVAEITEEAYRRFMKTWEEELNHFLKTGEKLADEKSGLTRRNRNTEATPD